MRVPVFTLRDVSCQCVESRPLLVAAVVVGRRDVVCVIPIGLRSRGSGRRGVVQIRAHRAGRERNAFRDVGLDNVTAAAKRVVRSALNRAVSLPGRLTPEQRPEILLELPAKHTVDHEVHRTVHYDEEVADVIILHVV